jgi:hypothetical protein
MIRGGFATRSFTAKIDFPSVTLNVRPLPEGAPSGFSGAVGTFSIEVRPLSLELELGGSLTVETRITGSGNIDQFPGPQLIDINKDWKQFETMAKPSGGERRSSSGTAEFSQVLRPLKKVETLPPYRFVYFDPLLDNYEKKESLPLPIKITGELPAPESLGESLEFLPPGELPLRVLGKSSPLTRWAWQLIPALITCSILGIAFRNKLKARQISLAPLRDFENELKEVISASNDRVTFFREAARFATEHDTTEGLEEIFEIRDEICFQQDPKPEPLQPSEKKRILRLLRILSPLLLFSISMAFLIQTSNGIELPPGEAKAEILESMKKVAVREHLHNLAICEQKLENYGEASLWAHRYQLHGGDSTKLMSGLPGFHARSPEGIEWLSILPRWIYFQIFLLGIWSLIISILTAWNIFGNKRKPFLVTFFVFTGFGLIIGITGMKLYPEGVSFEPLIELSIVTEKSAMRGLPFEGGDAIRENVIGSLCRVKTTRAGWSNIELPGGLTGWVRQTKVSSILE